MAYSCLYYKVTDRRKISRYELDLIRSRLLPQALPLSLKEEENSILLRIDLGQESQSLLCLDAKLKRNQALGLGRALLVLEAMQDAQERLLRPSFAPLNLSTVFLSEVGIRFPLLPVSDADVVPCSHATQNVDFWQEWAAFYKVQTELAAVGRRLSEQGEFKELISIYSRYLEESRPFPRNIQNTRVLSSGPRATIPFASQSASTYIPYQAGLKPGLLAELYLLKPGSQFLPQKRLALLADREFILGRDPSCSDLCFADPCIGRQHAKISKEKGQFFLEDLASLNGTFLEGRRVLRNESLLLPEACHIRLGRTELYFRRLPDQYSPLAAGRGYFVPNRRSPASPRPGTI
ncbi:MAG: FHA domain-containing protein [Eubacteriales bacterium]|nr:FHA domain-containing protein [Eubacteriales bacterium]